MVEKYKPQIIKLLAVDKGKQMLYSNFLNIKEQIATKFNKLPLAQKNENEFNSIIEKIDTDQ